MTNIGVGAQVVVLILLLIREARRRDGSNLLVVVTAVALLVLVVAQEMYVLIRIRQSAPVRLFGNVISREGAEAAIWWATLFILLFAVVVMLELRERPRRSVEPSEARLPLATYWLTFVAVVIGTAMVGRTLGGIGELLRTPGSIASGQAFWLAVVQIGKLPLIWNVWMKRRPSIGPIALFVLTAVVILLNSRILAGVMILELAIAWHYGRKPLRLRAFIAGGLVLVAVVLVYGTIRDFRQFYGGRGWTEYVGTGFGRGEAVEDFLYGTNIEGFSGFAGSMSRHRVSPIQFDVYGTYTARNAVFRSMPFEIRDRLFPGATIGGAAYDYAGSVVPGGLEQSFVQWSFPGIVVFGCGLGAIVVGADRALRRGRGGLFLVLMAPYVVVLVRGPFYSIFVDGLGQLGGLALFWSAIVLGRALEPTRVSGEDALGY